MADTNGRELGFDGGDGGFDGGVGDNAEGLGRIVFVAAELEFADAVGAGFEGEVGDGGFGAEGTAGEVLASGGFVREHCTTTGQEAGQGC